MAPTLTEDEIDDLLYFARIGELEDFQSTVAEFKMRENAGLVDLLQVAKDELSGNGPLHMAAANGHTAILEASLKELNQPTPQNPPMLAVLNAQNTAGNTPLHWAALNGHLECVKVLIDAGADPTITNNAGHDAVYEAELNDKREVVEWVLKESEGMEEGIAGDMGEGEGEGDATPEEGESSQSAEVGSEEAADALRAAVDGLDIKEQKD